MALLAEGKKKVKYGLDPRNMQWSKDENKFGQRLMEKMGWEKGKGLGAKENGMTEHIKASYKWDQRGLGATPQSGDAWVAHQDDFNDLLKKLNEGKVDEVPELKSKKEQFLDGEKRYYGRFARGRVQKLRTTEDLDCIFGRRKAASEPTTPYNQSVANSGDESGEVEDKKGTEESKATEKRHGLTTVTSSTSVQEYFAQKMREMQARRRNAGVSEAAQDGESNPEDKAEKKEDKETMAAPVYGRVGFSYDDGDGNEKDPSENGDSRDTGMSSRGWYTDWCEDAKTEAEEEQALGKNVKGSKKRKKKQDREEEILDTTVDNQQSGVGLQVGEEIAGGSIKSKKNKKKKALHSVKDEMRDEQSDRSPAHLETSCVSCVSETILNVTCGGESLEKIDESKETSSKSKKKKRKLREEGEEKNEQISKRRKLLTEAKQAEEGVDIVQEDQPVCDSRRKRKKRKRKEDAEERDKQADKQRKLSDDVEETEEGVDCMQLDPSVSDSKRKTKKKKGKKKVEYENEMINKRHQTPTEVEMTEKIEEAVQQEQREVDAESKAEQKKNKKKKITKEKTIEDENKLFETSQIDIIGKKKKKRKTDDIEEKDSQQIEVVEVKLEENDDERDNSCIKRMKKKKSKKKKIINSMFPGSNIETLQGYASFQMSKN